MYFLKQLIRINKSTSLNLRYLHQIIKPKSILNIPTIHNVKQIRTIGLFKGFKQETAEKFREEDKIPKTYELIYRNPNTNYLLGAQWTSVISAVGLLTGISATLDFNSTQIPDSIVTVSSVNEIYIYVGVLATFLVLTQAILSRFAARVYYSPTAKHYLFVNYGRLPTWRDKYDSQQEEISRLPDMGFLSWSDSTYAIGRRSGIVLIEEFFRNSNDFDILNGWRKPEDFE